MDVPDRNELTNLYLQHELDIILLNSTGQKDSEKIKIMNHNVYQRNKEGEAHAGVVVAVKGNIQHQIIDDFIDDTLAVKLETTKGPVIVEMCYHPPRRENFPVEDILKILGRNEPAYI